MRFFVYGDELLFSEALTFLLQQRGHVVGPCLSDTAELLEKITLADNSDVCLLDVHSPGSSIEGLLQQIREFAPALPVVMLTGECDISLLWHYFDAGADGICVKVDGIDEIEEVVVRTVAARLDGDEHPSVWSRGAVSLAHRSPRPTKGVKLTPKERAVLEHLVRGSNTAKIAAELGVGEATVRTHLQHLFTKFRVHSRLALVAGAVRADVVAVGPEQFRA